MLARTWSRSPTAACIRPPPRPRSAPHGHLRRAAGHPHDVPRLARDTIQLGAAGCCLRHLAARRRRRPATCGQAKSAGATFTETQAEAFVKAVLSNLSWRGSGLASTGPGVVTATCDRPGGMAARTTATARPGTGRDLHPASSGKPAYLSGTGRLSVQRDRNQERPRWKRRLPSCLFAFTLPSSQPGAAAARGRGRRGRRAAACASPADEP